MTERIWDKFLTRQDRDLAAAEPARRFGFGKKPALLMIDVYRGVFGEKPEPLLEAIERWPSSCGLAGWNALPEIRRLLEASRSAGIPVVYATGLNEEDCGVKSWGERGRAGTSVRHKKSSSGFGSRHEIMDEISPQPGEAVIRKTAPSAFAGTPLLAHLNSLGVDTLITCGESTSGCVRATVVDGRTYSYRMVVVEQCVFDRTEASHAVNLFDMDQKYADVLSLQEVTVYLQAIPREQVAALQAR